MLLLFYATVKGQGIPEDNLPTLNIQIISENDNKNKSVAQFEKRIKDEINTLLINRQKVVFNENYCNCSALEVTQLLNEAFNNSKIDIIIGVGPIASAILAQRENYPKPSIASLIICLLYTSPSPRD